MFIILFSYYLTLIELLSGGGFVIMCFLGLIEIKIEAIIVLEIRDCIRNKNDKSS